MKSGNLIETNPLNWHNQLSGSCRADWIRTSDPYVPNVVRYRAALLPEKGNHFSSEVTTLNLSSGSRLNRDLHFALSGRLDSNQRPPAPHAGTLPGCATSRMHCNNAGHKSMIYLVREKVELNRSKGRISFI